MRNPKQDILDFYLRLKAELESYGCTAPRSGGKVRRIFICPDGFHQSLRIRLTVIKAH